MTGGRWYSAEKPKFYASRRQHAPSTYIVPQIIHRSPRHAFHLDRIRDVRGWVWGRRREPKQRSARSIGEYNVAIDLGKANSNRRSVGGTECESASPSSLCEREHRRRSEGTQSQAGVERAPAKVCAKNAGDQ